MELPMPTKNVTAALVLSLCLGACGAKEAAAAPEEAAGPGAAPAAPAAAPADTSPVGAFGPFMLASNTIAVDGQCLEMGSTPVNGGSLSEADARRVLTDMLHIPAASISSARCPMADRVPGGCSINMLNGVNRYYTQAPHAMTPESARAHCDRNAGHWIN